ncbi:MAG: hypothetical protein E6I57_03570 [Chloroflexi bacterium]|nr:MAG: hypothetical protein E6J49_11085 [Chloroflexota bacterium]TMB77521.1 MAG: hypothetical protein E6J52_05940 [Chloroflexota bacterium]TMB96493.1 MAG: hypothetical protein E6J38_03795 [Chloroflexota bacterium]TMC27895.1 MAG: hypothetical protein E6J27_10090 [Chloroflexota bacterium]TMC32116.1 MAG: hypothetical protein E6J24_14540 [Chloroflexota bacterium]
MGLIELIIVILVIMWLLGYFGRGRWYATGPSVSTAAPPWGGTWIHTLIVLAIILIILRLLRVL